MMEKHITEYRGILYFGDKILYDFTMTEPELAFAKLANIIEAEYPSAEARVINNATGEVVYYCRRTPIC